MPTRHVLVPLLVVALVVWLFLWRGCGSDAVHPVASDVAECTARLRRIHEALRARAAREGHPPRESGVALLGALIASEALPDAERAVLTCPGPHAAPVPAGVDYRDSAGLTRADSAYAARDCASFPLASFPSGGSQLEPIAACDDEHGLNHEGCMNVLYSDGSVVTLMLAQEIERGHLPPDATTIPVGKGSPVPGLEKLTLD